MNSAPRLNRDPRLRKRVNYNQGSRVTVRWQGEKVDRGILTAKHHSITIYHLRSQATLRNCRDRAQDPGDAPCPPWAQDWLARDPRRVLNDSTLCSHCCVLFLLPCICYLLRSQCPSTYIHAELQTQSNQIKPPSFLVSIDTLY